MSMPNATTIFFSKEDVKELEFKHRIPPTTIGVRRIRPSNKAILNELKRQNRVKKEKSKHPNKKQSQQQETTTETGNDEEEGTNKGTSNTSNNEARKKADSETKVPRDQDKLVTSTSLLVVSNLDEQKDRQGRIEDDKKNNIDMGEKINDPNAIISCTGMSSDNNNPIKRKHQDTKIASANGDNTSTSPSSNKNKQLTDEDDMNNAKREKRKEEVEINNVNNNDNNTDSNTDNNTDNNAQHMAKQKQSYHQLAINAKMIQEEIAELKNVDRRAYNNLPVVLSPPMTYQYQAYIQNKDKGERKSETCIYNNNDQKLQQQHQQQQHQNKDPTIVINDDLACRWAKALHKVIEIEEIHRNKEDMRPLAYKLMPEVWTRLKSTTTSSPSPSPSPSNDSEIKLDDDGDEPQKTEDSSTFAITPNKTISCKNIRAEEYDQSWYNKSHEIVYNCLHNQFPNFHIACGAKFGCDYLLYDGSRMERHAFAGLRIIICPTGGTNEHGTTQMPMLNKIIQSDNDDDDDEGKECLFPLPTPYDLSGYVRGLNTAGKLALLAMVVKSNTTLDGVNADDAQEGGTMAHDSSYHVAIVDLALEKVMTAQAHVRKRAKKQSRKEVGLHLDKKKTY